MDQFAAHKINVEKRIVERLAESYGQEIQYSDFKDITSFIFKEIPAVKDQAALISFLKNLSWNWNIFEDILITEEAPVKKAQEEKTAEKVVDLIEQGKPDQAIDTANKVM